MMQKEYVGLRASDASSRLSSASTVRGSDAGFATGSLLSSARCGFQTASHTADAMNDPFLLLERSESAVATCMLTLFM
jgi:hypothetical protein